MGGFDGVSRIPPAELIFHKNISSSSVPLKNNFISGVAFSGIRCSIDTLTGFVNMTGLADMEKSFFGIVIQVSNLELCRAFYRDVLGLGAPVMDSTFWVEFRLDAGVSLFLEKSEVLDAAEKRGRISWFLRSDNPEELMNVLSSYGYAGRKLPADQVGFPVYRFHDPEGNPFFIAPKEEENMESGKEF